MSSSSDIRDVEVNVVSSPESNTSRNNSPEPTDNYRIINHLPTAANITCFPVIKTTTTAAGDDDNNSGSTKCDKDTAKGHQTTQKSSGASTNFSISSILSRSEPTVKKNNFVGVQTGQQNVLEAAINTSNDSAMLSR